MLRFTMVAVGGVAGLGGIGAVGCGFVPGLDPWLGSRSCLVIGYVSGKVLG
jgi:hypothetical protein